MSSFFVARRLSSWAAIARICRFIQRRIAHVLHTKSYPTRKWQGLMTLIVAVPIVTLAWVQMDRRLKHWAASSESCQALRLRIGEILEILGESRVAVPEVIARKLNNVREQFVRIDRMRDRDEPDVVWVELSGLYAALIDLDRQYELAKQAAVPRDRLSRALNAMSQGLRARIDADPDLSGLFLASKGSWESGDCKRAQQFSDLAYDRSLAWLQGHATQADVDAWRRSDTAAALDAAERETEQQRRLVKNQSTQIQKLQSQISDLADRVVRDGKNIADLQAQLASTDQKLREAEAALGQASQDALSKDQKLAAMEKDLEVARGEVADLRRRLASADQKLREAEAALGQASHYTQSLEEQLAAKKKDLQSAAREKAPPAGRSIGSMAGIGRGPYGLGGWAPMSTTGSPAARNPIGGMGIDTSNTINSFNGATRNAFGGNGSGRKLNPGKSPVPGPARGPSAIRGSSTVEQLRRRGWLTTR
jgi:hypothetical protein